MPYGENLCLNICVPNETCFACLNCYFARPGHLMLCFSPPFFLSFGGRRRSVWGRDLGEG